MPCKSQTRNIAVSKAVTRIAMGLMCDFRANKKIKPKMVRENIRLLNLTVIAVAAIIARNTNLLFWLEFLLFHSTIPRASSTKITNCMKVDARSGVGDESPLEEIAR